MSIVSSILFFNTIHTDVTCSAVFNCTSSECAQSATHGGRETYNNGEQDEPNEELWDIVPCCSLFDQCSHCGMSAVCKCKHVVLMVVCAEGGDDIHDEEAISDVSEQHSEKCCGRCTRCWCEMVLASKPCGTPTGTPKYNSIFSVAQGPLSKFPSFPIQLHNIRHYPFEAGPAPVKINAPSSRSRDRNKPTAKSTHKN